MAVIPALTENADAALGLLTEANSFVDKITGTGAGARIVAGGYDGPRAIEVAPAGSPNINRVDYPATPRLWQSWYIQPETWPSTTPTATDAWYSGNATKVADVRPAADRTLELRSANNSRWTSTPLASNEWHRVAVLIAPNISGTGTLRLRIYSGATRDSMTVSQDSQNRNAAVMVASTDNYRFGCLSPDILRYKRDRFRADDAVEPAGVPAPTPPPDPDDPDPPPVDPVVVTPSTEQVVKPFEPVTVTASSSGGTGPYTYAWSVVSGGPLNIPGLTTARRTFVAPARVDGADLVLQVQSTDSLGAVSDPKTVDVTVVPHAEFYARPDGTLRPVRTTLASVVSSPMPSPAGPFERWDGAPPIVPWMLTLEGRDDVEALAPAGLEPAVAGADAAMRDVADLDASVNGGYRGFGFLNTTWDEDPVWRATVEAMCYRRSLQSLWWGGVDTADRYNLARYQQMAAGDFDQRAREWVHALPIGTTGPGPKRPVDGSVWYQFYAALMHEPDIYTDLTGLTASQVAATKDAYKAGVQRLISVMVAAAQEKSAHAYEFAVGGLLAASDPDTASDWRWWEGMNPTVKASGLVGHFWDEYFEHDASGAAMSFRARVDARVAEFAAEGGWGLLRPVVAETSLRWHRGGDPTYAVVGTNESALVWEAEVLDWLENGPGEGVAFFNAGAEASATGSYFAEGRYAWRLQHAANHKRLNRRGGGHPGSLGAYPLPEQFQPDPTSPATFPATFPMTLA